MFVELKTPPNVFVRCGIYSNTHNGWKGMDFMKVNIYPSTTFYFLEEVIRISDSVIITKTKHGFICANSGVDNSNISEGLILLLPKDPDKSALEIRNEIKKELTIDIAVIITDSFGRPWRNGQVDIAIGTSGIEMIKDYRGLEDKYGNRLQATEIAIIDELAAAAELVKGKTDQIPIAIIRNYMYRKNDKPIKQIIRDKNIDLFL